MKYFTFCHYIFGPPQTQRYIYIMKRNASLSGLRLYAWMSFCTPREITLLERRSEQIEKGKEERSCKPERIFELSQNLVEHYVTFPAAQKRQTIETVFSNLQLDDVNLCAEYRLPFFILAENAHRPLDYARQDSNLRPSV